MKITIRSYKSFSFSIKELLPCPGRDRRIASAAMEFLAGDVNASGIQVKFHAIKPVDANGDIPGYEVEVSYDVDKHSWPDPRDMERRLEILSGRLQASRFAFLVEGIRTEIAIDNNQKYGFEESPPQAGCVFLLEEDGSRGEIVFGLLKDGYAPVVARLLNAGYRATSYGDLEAVVEAQPEISNLRF